MSSLLRPVGPNPARVYWRRRLTVLGVAVAILALIIVLIAQPWAGNADQNSPTALVTNTPSATPSAQAVAPEETAAAPAPEPAPAAPVEAAPPSCAPADVRVRAVTDSDSYSPGVAPHLGFTVTNTSSAPCVINAGTSQQVFTITSGDDVYWRSTDCQVDPSDTIALLEPGVEVPSASIAWDRTRSAPDTCGSERPPVPGGGASYHLRVTVDGRESAESRQFLLY